MATYTAVTTGQRDAESPVDTTLIGQVIDNPVAITEGAPGSPKNQTASYATGSVDQAAMGVSAVGQLELKETQGVVSRSGTTSSALYTLPGGSYGLRTSERYFVNSGGNAGMSFSYGNQGSGNTAYFAANSDTGIINQVSLYVENNAATMYVYSRYIQASPPYDLGDGIVGRFIFAVIDNATSKVESVYQAAEAPWHYSGPTDIRGKLVKDGKKYRVRKDMSSIPASLVAAKNNPAALAAYATAFKNAPLIQEEITQEIKQADMGLIPHPFMGNDLTGKTVVMLDPVSDLNHELSELCDQHDEFDLNELLHDGALVISNIGLKRSGPKGILIPSFKWKKAI